MICAVYKYSFIHSSIHLWKKINLRFKECLCFGWLGWKIKSKIQHLLHVCFQSSVKCEKIICSGELGTTPSKKLANLGLRIQSWIFLKKPTQVIYNKDLRDFDLPSGGNVRTTTMKGTAKQLIAIVFDFQCNNYGYSKMQVKVTNVSFYPEVY